jgi:hypothetical protein
MPLLEQVLVAELQFIEPSDCELETAVSPHSLFGQGVQPVQLIIVMVPEAVASGQLLLEAVTV